MYWLPCSFGFPKDKHVIIESLLGTLKLNMIPIQEECTSGWMKLFSSFSFRLKNQLRFSPKHPRHGAGWKAITPSHSQGSADSGCNYVSSGSRAQRSRRGHAGLSSLLCLTSDAGITVSRLNRLLCIKDALFSFSHAETRASVWECSVQHVSRRWHCTHRYD